MSSVSLSTKMKKRKPASPRAGDVFQFQVPESRFGYGQIIVKMTLVYAVIFRTAYEHAVSVDDAIGDDIELVGWTSDAWIHHGRWAIVGNAEPPTSRIPFQSYKVEKNGEILVCEFTGKSCRTANAAEAELLDFRKSVSPAVLHNAYLATLRLAPWSTSFDHLTARGAWKRVISF